MLDQTPILCACVRCSVKQNGKKLATQVLVVFNTLKTSNEFSRFVSFRCFNSTQCVPTAVSHSTINVKSLKMRTKEQLEYGKKVKEMKNRRFLRLLLKLSTDSCLCAQMLYEQSGQCFQQPPQWPWAQRKRAAKTDCVENAWIIEHLKLFENKQILPLWQFLKQNPICSLHFFTHCIAHSSAPLSFQGVFLSVLVFGIDVIGI